MMEYRVPIGNRRVYAEYSGTGKPTIVIEAGAGQPGTSDPGWLPIREKLAADYGIVTYDRAGTGRSEPAGLPRSIQEFSVDLDMVLTAINPPKPIILIGHSFGGLLALAYARAFPAGMAGVILLDASHPGHDPQALARLPPKTADEPPALGQFRSLLQYELSAAGTFAVLEGLALNYSTTNSVGAGSLGAIPLLVYTAGRNDWNPGFPVEVAAQYAELWLELQHELAASSTASRQVIVENCGHCIHLEQPDIVAEALVELHKLAGHTQTN